MIFLAKSKTMITAYAGVFILLVAAALVLSGCTGKAATTQGNAVGVNGSHAPPSGQQRPNFQGRPPAGPQIAVGDTFSNSTLAKYAYNITGASLSADAKKATAGFNITRKSLADGSVNISLTANKAGYVSQSFIVKPGQTLYFIELAMGDDSATGDNDYRLSDDMGVLVNANGTVAQAPDGMMSGFRPRN